jgi:hypothetical protein
MKETFADYIEKLVNEYFEYSKDVTPKKEEVPNEDSLLNSANNLLKKIEEFKTETPEKSDNEGKDSVKLSDIVPLPQEWESEVKSKETKEVKEKKPRKRSAKNFVNIPRK